MLYLLKVKLKIILKNQIIKNIKNKFKLVGNIMIYEFYYLRFWKYNVYDIICKNLLSICNIK